MAFTTNVAMGYKASEAYIKQIFGYDDRMPGIVAAEFDAIAEENGSVAELCVYTSSVYSTVDDVDTYDDDYGDWLQQALDSAEAIWQELPELG